MSLQRDESKIIKFLNHKIQKCPFCGSSKADYDLYGEECGLKLIERGGGSSYYRLCLISCNECSYTCFFGAGDLEILSNKFNEASTKEVKEEPKTLWGFFKNWISK